MSMKPDSSEISLVGSWIGEGTSITQDSVCERIQWLTDKYFEQMIVDGDNWSALYKNPDDGSYWELTYPQSHMQGGGPPTLKRVSNDYAQKQYGIEGL